SDDFRSITEDSAGQRNGYNVHGGTHQRRPVVPGPRRRYPLYLIRRGTLEQLTQDHSLAMDQLRRGLISKEEAAHVNQNILTRSLGTQKEVAVDLDEHPLFPGDTVLLCSDGV